MQRVCDVLEELTDEGILGNYAIGGAPPKTCCKRD